MAAVVSASLRIHVLLARFPWSSGNPVFMRVKTNPPPFTMRLCPAFVNRKTDICSVFSLFFQDFSQFPWFYAGFRKTRVEKANKPFVVSPNKINPRDLSRDKANFETYSKSQTTAAFFSGRARAEVC
jgi:hypothetical protein